jgi:hypothetical protein
MIIFRKYQRNIKDPLLGFSLGVSPRFFLGFSSFPSRFFNKFNIIIHID